jgi:hypothetical protein
MANEVALFVDLENVVYSLWNAHMQEPNPRQWMAKALGYGSVTFARAFGDFSQERMAKLRPRLDIAGIDTYSCPAKVRESGTQSTVDINVAIDLFEVAMDRPEVKTFILMAGDRDYIRIITRIRNRWNKQIIVSGVPGSVSHDLAEAADIVDPIEINVAAIDECALLRIILRYEQGLIGDYQPTFKHMQSYIMHPSNSQVIDPSVVQRALSDFVDRGVLIQEVINLADGGQLKATKLNHENPLVQQAF